MILGKKIGDVALAVKYNVNNNDKFFNSFEPGSLFELEIFEDQYYINQGEFSTEIDEIELNEYFIRL